MTSLWHGDCICDVKLLALNPNQGPLIRLRVIFHCEEHTSTKVSWFSEQVSKTRWHREQTSDFALEVTKKILSLLSITLKIKRMQNINIFVKCNENKKIYDEEVMGVSGFLVPTAMI